MNNARKLIEESLKMYGRKENWTDDLEGFAYERMYLLAKALEVAINTLEFFKERYYSDKMEGPELRAQNATSYTKSDTTLSEIESIIGGGE